MQTDDPAHEAQQIPPARREPRRVRRVVRTVSRAPVPPAPVPPAPARSPWGLVLGVALLAGLFGGVAGVMLVVGAQHRPPAAADPGVAAPVQAGQAGSGAPGVTGPGSGSGAAGGGPGAGAGSTPGAEAGDTGAPAVPAAQFHVEFSSAISQAAEQVGPAVVGVVNQVRQRQGHYDLGTGSGVIINRAEGLIVTNHHVVAIEELYRDLQRLTVHTSDGAILEAELVGSDPLSDLAVIRATGGTLPAQAEFGDSDRVRLGDLAIAIGNPLGLDFARTVTAGIISGTNREVTFESEGAGETTLQLLQTDAAINPGNSGGALVNAAGQVIGINSIKINQAEVEGIGFAIPVNFARPIIEDLVRYGRVLRPVLGIYSYRSQAEQVMETGYRGPGLVIADVIAGYPAAAAGLQRGDIVLTVGDQPVNRLGELALALGRYRPGDQVTVRIRRYGGQSEAREFDIQVTLRAAEAD